MNISIKHLIGGLVILIIIIGGFLSYRGRSYEVVNYPLKEGSVVAFGDSLVDGVGSTRDNDFVSILSKMIGEEIVNLGVSGNTTAQGLLRIDEVLEKQPRLVLVLLGGNDVIRRISKDETFQNLSEIVTKIQDEGAAVLVLGIRGGILSDTYNDDFKAFSRKHATAYVPNVLDGLIGTPGLMSDAIHPNNKGYLIIAQKILPVLENLLR